MYARGYVSGEKGSVMYRKEVGPSSPVTGMSYLDFLPILGTALNCRSYFEIGTNTGDSLKAFQCDSVCVDPHFLVAQDVLRGKRQAHFFQMTSNEFFDNFNLRSLLPGGIDIGFLDGLHHFEVLLRDFINSERYCHDKSVLMLHDCIPINERMAEREFRYVETESPDTRGGWTGDVWRLLPILKKYRPDLRVMLFDCHPTGLIVCTGLRQFSRVLEDNYATIIEDYARLSLSDHGIQQLWGTFPVIDSTALAASPGDLPAVLFG